MVCPWFGKRGWRGSFSQSQLTVIQAREPGQATQPDEVADAWVGDLYSLQLSHHRS